MRRLFVVLLFLLVGCSSVPKGFTVDALEDKYPLVMYHPSGMKLTISLLDSKARIVRVLLEPIKQTSTYEDLDIPLNQKVNLGVVDRRLVPIEVFYEEEKIKVMYPHSWLGIPNSLGAAPSPHPLSGD